MVIAMKGAENEMEEELIYQKPCLEEAEQKLVYHGDNPPPGVTTVLDPDDDPDF